MEPPTMATEGGDRAIEGTGRGEAGEGERFQELEGSQLELAASGGVQLQE
jgi:hypothetical protein